MPAGQLIIPLAAVEAHHAGAIGPKAMSLTRLVHLGMPVPEAFCVTAEAYRRHLEENDLRGRIDGAEPELARQAIIDAPISGALATAIEAQLPALGAGLLSVRSSATKEDLADQSFAGQHDTILGVSGQADCLQAIKRCWASLWTDRAHAYRNRNGIGHEGVEMAVIVQRLVAAEASGVLFTADPVTGATEVLTLECGLGLGEALVSGRITPDRFRIRREDLSVADRSIAAKSVEIVPGPDGGVIERPVAPPRADTPAVSDVTAARIAKLCLKTEQEFGVPLDVEWAVGDGEIYLLQARPITTAPAEKSWEDRQVWTNANAGEVVPDVMTPMTVSAVMPLVDRLFSVISGFLGTDLSGVDVYGIIAGRVYFNVNTFAAIARGMPVLRHKSMAEIFGGRQDEAAALGQIEIADRDLPDLKVRWWRGLLRLPGIAWSFLTFSIDRANAFNERIGRETEQQWRTPWRDLPDDGLRDRLRDQLDHIIEDEGFIYVAVGVAYSVALYDVCRRWMGNDGAAIAGRLLAGLGTMEHAEAGLELWKLADHAHRHPRLREAVASAKQFDRLAAALPEIEGGNEFRTMWEEMLWRHGHHTRGEAELSNPRWAEQPDYVLQLLRGCLAGVGKADPVGRAEKLAADRPALIAQCRRRLRNPLKRVIFNVVLTRGLGGAPIRENGKSVFVRRLALARQMLLELGGRAAKRKLIGAADDIFFLVIDELEALLAGRDAETLRQRIADRRAEHERNSSITPPSVIVGRFDPRRFEPDSFDESAEVLEGLVVSPGRVTGTARVILHAGTDSVAPGEILVAPFTDPGWTPYFLNAAAIVMDMGGMLSHGAIVAREYGIPCIVNVGPATKIIRTGDTLSVDGDRGTVRILRAP